MLKQNKAQTTILIIVVLVLFILTSILLSATTSLNNTALEGIMQKQEQQMSEATTLDWQYNEAVRVALFDGIVAYGESDWQTTTPELFLKEFIEQEFLGYLQFIEQEQNKNVKANVTLYNNKIMVDVVAHIEKERVGYRVEKENATLIVEYDINKARAIAMRTQTDTVIVEQGFSRQGNQLIDNNSRWRGKPFSYTLSS